MEGLLARLAVIPFDLTLTVLMFDVNGLKMINDRYGHSAGDLALREFATAVRSSDIAARMSGDEFLAIVPECTSQGWPQILSRMTGLSVDYRGETIPVRFATGWAEFVPGEPVEKLLERADAQMYEDKRTGGAERKAVAAQEHVRAHRLGYSLIKASVPHTNTDSLPGVKLPP